MSPFEVNRGVMSPGPVWWDGLHDSSVREHLIEEYSYQSSEPEEQTGLVRPVVWVRLLSMCLDSASLSHTLRLGHMLLASSERAVRAACCYFAWVLECLASFRDAEKLIGFALDSGKREGPPV